MKLRAKYLMVAGSAVLLLGFGVSAQAQDASSAAPPPAPAGHGFAHHSMGRDEIGFLGFEGSFTGKTVTGAPFSATFSTESSETLADGNQIQHNTTGSIARDSQGRTRRDMTLPAFGPWATPGQTPPHVTFLNDPVAGKRFMLDDGKKTARTMPAPMNRSEFTSSRQQSTGSGEAGGTGGRRAEFSKETVTTSLGTQMVGGVSAEGTRYTRTIPAGQIGNAKPIVIVTERWYSPDLQMVVMTKRSDPRSGETTFQMTGIQRVEPAATLFAVPADYTLKSGRHGGHGHGAGAGSVATGAAPATAAPAPEQ